jgi:hypothetical protein
MTSVSQHRLTATDIECLVEAVFVHDDRALIERLREENDAERGTAFVADRVRALATMLDRQHEALRTAAERPGAMDAVIEEYRRIQARLADYAAPSKRAEPAWCLLHDYGWSWARLLLSDGPTLLAAWDAAARERGEAPCRRLREGGAREGRGRRLGPVVHDALSIAAIELADLLSAWRIVAHHRDRAVSHGDHVALRRLTDKAYALRQVHRIEAPPEDFLSTLVRWAGLWLFLAAHLADAPFTEVRVGRDHRAPFREAARSGADSPEWLAVTEALVFRDDEVKNALGSAALRREDAGARGGPLVAAAVAVEKVTGVSAGTIERHARARLRAA